MEHNYCKFPVQHPYIKVENNRSISHGSVGNPADDLSYSYSCINAFRKNQSIIKNLTSLHVDKNFQGEGHEPLLYSLSGDREKPICGPFYYSTSSGGAKNNYYSTEELIKIEDPSSSCLESEYENKFFDKRALFDWLKDQVKYVNVLWSFSKSSYINLSKLCKCKNQEVKMEMLLNNIDENTKTRLRRYLNELNLDLEERCTLFNESTIEIDITPLLADKSKLQAFLSFLKTIDNGVYNSVEGNKTQPFNQLPERTEKKITNKYISPTKEIKQGERATRRDRQLRTCSEDRTNWQISRFPENNDELSKGCIVKPKHTEIYEPKLSHNYKETSRNIKVRAHSPSPSNFPHENSLKAPSGSGNVKHRAINNNQSLSNKDKLSRKPRARFESTLAKQRSLNCLVDRKQTNRILDDPTPSAEEQSNVSDTNRAQTDRKLSCKCLIHLRQEDYYRYRNQCLFGKGDETSNNFVKYLTDKEREAECQVHKCKQNAEKLCRKTLETKHIKDEQFYELEDECCHAFRKNKKVKYENKNENSKRAVVEDNKLKRAAEKDCTRKSSQNNYYKTDETIRVGDVERLMYSINYNDSNYNNEDGCFYNNLGLNRSKPNRMTVAEEEPSSFNACFESLSYERSANSTCEKSKSDTGINGKFAPVEYGHMNSENEPMEKMNKKVNEDHWYRCHSIKPSVDQDLQTKRNFDLKNDKNPSVQVLHCNKRLQNYVDTKLSPHNYTSDEFIMFNDGIKQSSYKKLPIREKNLKTKRRKSLQSLGSSHSYESKTNADKRSLLTNYSRIGLLDKMSVVIKTNRSNDGARPQLKETKPQRTHLSLNSLRPKNLYRNISTVFKQKSSTNKSKSQQTKINVSSVNVPSLSEEKFKCKIKETKPTRNLNLRQKNCCDSVSKRDLPSSDSSEAKPECASMLTELLDRLITELQNQRIEINEIKKSLNDQKDRSDA